LFCRVNRKSGSAAEIAKPAAIVESHDVVRVGMGKKYRVKPADVFAQDLEAEFRGGVDHQFDLVSRDKIEGRVSVIFWISQELCRVFLAYERGRLEMCPSRGK
jgi:hypothetical protein